MNPGSLTVEHTQAAQEGYRDTRTFGGGRGWVCALLNCGDGVRLLKVTKLCTFNKCGFLCGS